MRFFIAVVSLIVSIVIYGCLGPTKSIKIDTIRIEDIEVNKLLHGGSKIGTLRAEWSGSTIDLYYDFKDIQSAPLKLSYDSESDYEYSYSAPDDLTATGTILSVPSNTEISWDEIADQEKPETKDLAFVTWTDRSDEKYKDMVYIPGGSFTMGSKFNKNELPKHRVYVDGFYMDKYEVTVAQFRKFCKATRRRMPKQPYWNNENHPVVNVSWDYANAYAKWKGKRLPTEAEWEYTARSGSRRYYYSWGNIKPTRRRGGNIADESIRAEKRNWKIWKGYFDGFVYTAPVGRFYPNQFGLYDMTGNVSEWCSDWYEADYYKKSPERNPKGPAKGTHKVLRGGSWNLGPRKVLTTRRFYFRRDVNLNFIGFRCVKD
jgi:formylglycine-generating enzyme required for sulfatase activity